jgi:hypothetical protein
MYQQFIFSQNLQSHSGNTQCSIPFVLDWRAKWLGCDADHHLVINAEVKNVGIYFFTLSINL